MAAPSEDSLRKSLADANAAVDAQAVAVRAIKSRPGVTKPEIDAAVNSLKAPTSMPPPQPSSSKPPSPETAIAPSAARLPARPSSTPSSGRSSTSPPSRSTAAWLDSTTTALPAVASRLTSSPSGARANRTKILEYLRDVWATDRKAEWSIWMVHSKIEIPHRYLRSRDDTSHRNSLGKISVSRKSNDDPAQSATVRADLHRKSIAQMKINSRSIQDMHLFGEPPRQSLGSQEVQK